MWTARSPPSEETNRTVTRAFTFGFPSTRVSGVTRNVRVEEFFPSTVRLTVILPVEREVMVPEKNWSCTMVLGESWAPAGHSQREIIKYKNPVKVSRTLTAYVKRMKPP